MWPPACNPEWWAPLRTEAGILQRLRRAWRFLRQVSGDDAYERYLVHHARAHPGECALSRRGYFDQRQKQKWSGVNRCC